MNTNPLENLEWEVGSWASVEFRVQHDLHDRIGSNNDGKPYNVKIDEHYIEVGTGKRYAELFNRGPDGHQYLKRYYSDGNRCADAVYQEDSTSKLGQVRIKRTFGAEGAYGLSQAPPPLKYLYLELEPIHQKLKDALEVGQARLLGRPCRVYVISDVQWANNPALISYTLDEATGWPLRIQCYASETNLEQDQPNWTWEARSFEEVDGRHFPTRSVEKLYAVSSGDTRLIATRDLKVRDLAFDRDYSNTPFWPSMTNGCMVWDDINGKHYIYGEAEGHEAPPLKAEAPVDPIRVRESVEWSTMFSTGSVVMGVILLAVAIWFRIRR